MTQSPPPPASAHASVGHARVSGTTARLRVSCAGSTGSTCTVAVRLTVTERFRGHKLIGLSAGGHVGTHRKVLVVGSARVTLTAGQSRTLLIALNRAGRQLLATHHHLAAKLEALQVLPGGQVASVAKQTVTFKARHRPRKH
jgi:hypothetical protein